MCVPNLHCECQELKPKVETNTSFLVRHPFSGVDTVKTVGSHLNNTVSVDYYIAQGCFNFHTFFRQEEFADCIEAMQEKDVMIIKVFCLSC